MQKIKRTPFTIFTITCFLFPIVCVAELSKSPDLIEEKALSVLMLEVFNGDERVATGSGFVMFDNMTLVTNYHVIEDATIIMADSDDGYQYFITKVLITDKEKDIAILQFMTPTIMKPLTPSTQKVKRGETVIAIGSPIGLKNTVSMGNVSSVYTEDNQSWIQFTAAISHGSSGGALFNDHGDVIGITSAFWKEGQNLNLAVDINEVVALYRQWDGTKYKIEEYAKADISKSIATATPRPTAKPGTISKPTIKVTVIPKPTPTATPKPTRKPTAIPKLLPAAKVVSFIGDESYRIRANEELALSSILRVTPLNASFSSIRWNAVLGTEIWKTVKADDFKDMKNISVRSYFSGSSKSTKLPQCRIKNGKITFNKPGIYALQAAASDMDKWAACAFIVEPEDGVMLFFADSAYASWDYISNKQLSIKFQVTNSIYGKNIKAFELYVYATDVWGNRLYGNSVYKVTTAKNVYAGNTIYSNNIAIPDSDSIYRVYCGIHKVMYEDGTIATANQVDYCNWIIKK